MQQATVYFLKKEKKKQKEKQLFTTSYRLSKNTCINIYVYTYCIYIYTYDITLKLHASQDRRIRTFPHMDLKLYHDLKSLQD